jgi:hypothetical protein
MSIEHEREHWGRAEAEILRLRELLSWAVGYVNAGATMSGYKCGQDAAVDGVLQWLDDADRELKGLRIPVQPASPAEPAPVAAGPTPGERVAADMVSVHGESLMFKDGKMVAYAVASNVSFVTRTIARAIDAARAEAAAEATERAAKVAEDESRDVGYIIAAAIRRGA